MGIRYYDEFHWLNCLILSINFETQNKAKKDKQKKKSKIALVDEQLRFFEKQSLMHSNTRAINDITATIRFRLLTLLLLY